MLHILDVALPDVSASFFCIVSHVFQLDFSERNVEWTCITPSFSIDTTFCPIERPRLEPWEYYNSHYAAYGLKYQICCSILPWPHIIDLCGPFTGNSNDLTLARKTVVPLLQEGEVGLADASYNKDRVHFMASFGKTHTVPPELLSLQTNIHRVRQNVERLYKRTKDFRVLQTPWRYSYELHGDCMTAICKITNLNLIFEPLDKNAPALYFVFFTVRIVTSFITIVPELVNNYS